MTRRLPFALLLVLSGLAWCLGGCDEYRHSALWSLTWSWEGRSRDVRISDPGFTCEASARDQGNTLAMLRTTRVRACVAWCRVRSGQRPRSSCTLTCAAGASFRGGRCQTKSEQRPFPIFAR